MQGIGERRDRVRHRIAGRFVIGTVARLSRPGVRLIGYAQIDSIPIGHRLDHVSGAGRFQSICAGRWEWCAGSRGRMQDPRGEHVKYGQAARVDRQLLGMGQIHLLVDYPINLGGRLRLAGQATESQMVAQVVRLAGRPVRLLNGGPLVRETCHRAHDGWTGGRTDRRQACSPLACNIYNVSQTILAILTVDEQLSLD